jgi:Spy/CpxP family protein refolding chaperone
MRSIALAVLVAVASLVSAAALAEDKIADVTDMQALRSAVKADKRAFVAATMKLTDAEAKRFWPIYDTYQRNVDANNRERVVTVQELMFRDKPLTNLAAKQYANQLLALDESEIKARRTMRNRVMRALPALKAARYMQLEEKIRAVQEYDIASTVPLVR